MKRFGGMRFLFNPRVRSKRDMCTMFGFLDFAASAIEARILAIRIVAFTAG